MEDGVEHDAGAVSRKGPSSRRHFVEHDAEGEQVRARVDGLSFNLFRRNYDSVPTAPPAPVHSPVVVSVERDGQRNWWRGCLPARNRESWSGRSR